MTWYNELLTKDLAGFTVQNLLIILGCILGALLLDRISQWIIKALIRRSKRRTSESNIRTAMLEAVSKPLHVLFLTLGCSLGLLIIDPPAWGVELFSIIRLIIGSISLWCFIWYLMRATDSIARHMADKAVRRGDKVQSMLIPVIRGVAKFVFAAIGVLVVVQNLGYSVSSILTGLGIGGAAIALAAKDTVANFFGSLVVFFDHPFDIGDWVSFSGVDGFVEEIRVRTTLIRSFDGSVIMVPNSVLTNANINNYERRQLRRLDANFGVLYSTKPEQIEKIVSDITQYIYDHPDILGRKHYIGFSGFGDSSLDIFVMAYSTKIGLADFCKVRQQFLLAIMRIVTANGTSFAFPTRTLDFSNALPVTSSAAAGTADAPAGTAGTADIDAPDFPEIITEPVLPPSPGSSTPANATADEAGTAAADIPPSGQPAHRNAGGNRNDWSFSKLGNDIRRHAMRNQAKKYPWLLSPEMAADPASALTDDKGESYRDRK